MSVYTAAHTWTLVFRCSLRAIAHCFHSFLGLLAEKSEYILETTFRYQCFMKIVTFELSFIDICSQRSDAQYSIIG